jgi:hypothetical protein
VENFAPSRAKRPTAATLRHWLKNDQNAPCAVVFGVDEQRTNGCDFGSLGGAP